MIGQILLIFAKYYAFISP